MYPPNQMGNVLATGTILGTRIASETQRGVVYRLDRKLGEGGTASAYLAARVTAEGESSVVMKIIHPQVAAQSDDTATMVVRKEAVALSRLNQRVPPTPFVVRFMDAGSLEFRHEIGRVQIPWLAIEYVHGGVEGTTLQDRVTFSVKRTGFAFDRERAARVIAHVCEGLAEVHQVGVIHRDLTPNNVLCTGFGANEVFKISDFGIARPEGMEATFGAGVLGTPGYIAPEQGLGGEGRPSNASDIFSVAGIVYFVLTGEMYFEVTNPIQALMSARSAKRRSLLDARALCPELRDDPEATQALDDALARASSQDPGVRPHNAAALAHTLLPVLADCSSSHPSARHLSSVLAADVSLAALQWEWRVRQPPGEGRVVRSVGWDGDGHGLAATEDGPAFWNGTDWLHVPESGVTIPGGARFVRRAGPGRWLAGGDAATLAEYSRGGVSRVLRGPDESVTFTTGVGDLTEIAVVVAERHGQPPLLFSVICGHWLKPLPVPQAANIASVARLDETNWLVAGRGRNGNAFLALYRPLAWEIDQLPAPETRALLACAGQVERRVGFVAGSQGVVIRIVGGRTTVTRVESGPDFASVDVDVMDRAWAGASGELWASPDHGASWGCVWRDPGWQAPFISILADVGLVVAMTADGAVLECRANFSRVTVPPPASRVRGTR